MWTFWHQFQFLCIIFDAWNQEASWCPLLLSGLCLMMIWRMPPPQLAWQWHRSGLINPQWPPSPLCNVMCDWRHRTPGPCYSALWSPQERDLSQQCHKRAGPGYRQEEPLVWLNTMLGVLWNRELLSMKMSRLTWLVWRVPLFCIDTEQSHPASGICPLPMLNSSSLSLLSLWAASWRFFPVVWFTKFLIYSGLDAWRSLD